MTDKLQKTMSDTASTIVVMNGLATTAGSRCRSFANNGRQDPMILATQIVKNSAKETVKEIKIV